MVHRDREWERINWEQSRPGDSTRPLDRGIAGRLLTHPLRTMLVLVSVSALFLLGSYAIFGYGDPSLSAGHEAVAGTLEVDGTICCTVYREIDGQEYVFLTVLDNPGFFRTTSRDVSLRVVRLDDGAPEQVASLDAPVDSTLPLSMARVGDRLYVPLGRSDDDAHGIWLVDVSSPGAPEDAGLHPGGRVNYLASNEDLLVAHSAEQFSLLDVTDPNALDEISTLQRPQPGVRQIQIDGDRLYYLAYDAGQVRIADFAHLEAPSPLGRHLNEAALGQSRDYRRSTIGSAEERLDATAPASRFHDFSVAGDYLYVAASDRGLEIVDVSDPTSAVTLGEIQTEGRAVRTAIAEGHLYVVTVDEHSRERLAYEVHRFVLADPERPVPVGVIDDIRAVPGRQAFETGGGYLFLGLNDTLLVLEPAD